MVGFAKVAGVTPVQVNIINEHDDIAIVIDNNNTSLKSWTGGQVGASILWHAEGTTGLQWCLVLMGAFRSKFATMYRAALDDALGEEDLTVTVNTLVPMDGIQHFDTDSLTAHNVFSWEGSNEATALVVWNNHAGVERWELIQLDCA